MERQLELTELDKANSSENDCSNQSQLMELTEVSIGVDGITPDRTYCWNQGRGESFTVPGGTVSSSVAGSTSLHSPTAR
eukprot:5800516-Amphidinium_carterae.1